MRIAAYTYCVIEDTLCPLSHIWIETAIFEKACVEKAGQDLSIERDRFLSESLGVANIAVGDFAEGVFWLLTNVLLEPFLSSF